MRDSPASAWIQATWSFLQDYNSCRLIFPTRVKNTPISSTVLRNIFLYPIIHATWNLCGTTIIQLAQFLFTHIRNINSIVHIINKWNIQCAQTCWKTSSEQEVPQVQSLKQPLCGQYYSLEYCTTFFSLDNSKLLHIISFCLWVRISKQCWMILMLLVWTTLVAFHR